MDSIRSKMARRQPPASVGNYTFEDGRAAHFFRVATNFTVRNPGPEHLELIRYSAEKFGCAVTGPGIDHEVQVL